MTVNTNVRSQINFGSLQTFLASILYGLAFMSLVRGVSGASLFIVIVATVILALRHLDDWFVVMLGAVASEVLALLIGWQFPDVGLLGLVLLALLV